MRFVLAYAAAAGYAVAAGAAAVHLAGGVAGADASPPERYGLAAFVYALAALGLPLFAHGRSSVPVTVVLTAVTVSASMVLEPVIFMLALVPAALAGLAIVSRPSDPR